MEQREIKFRAWHNVDWVMWYNHSACLQIDGTVSFLTKSGEWEKDDDRSMITLMQYTGLKDKNGKEIYEGDIFGSQQLRCVVERLEDGAYVLKFVDKRIGNISILDRKVKTSTIIGNIYEHPHLLSSEQNVQVSDTTGDNSRNAADK